MPTAGTCTAFIVFTHSVRSAVIDPSKFCKSDTESWRAAWRRDQGIECWGYLISISIYGQYFGYTSESKYMVPSTGKNKTRLRLDQLGLSLLHGLHVCFVSFEGLTHAKQRKVADWKHQTPIQPKHEATSRSSCRRCLSSASSACSRCPHLQSQAITDQWWIAPLGHRICLKNPKQCARWLPKLVPKWHWNSDTSCISPSIKFKKENSERIVIFPRKIRNFAFFLSSRTIRARKICTFIGKIAFRSLFACFCVSNSKGK